MTRARTARPLTFLALTKDESGKTLDDIILNAFSMGEAEKTVRTGIKEDGAPDPHAVVLVEITEENRGEYSLDGCRDWTWDKR